jgi:hypothetical protein
MLRTLTDDADVVATERIYQALHGRETRELYSVDQPRRAPESWS